MKKEKKQQAAQPAQDAKQKKKFSWSLLKSRRFRHGSMATVITILFLVAVIVVNAIVNVLSDRVKMSVDLTQQQAYNLTQDSIDFVAGLEKDVEIIVLNDESEFTYNGQYYVQANEVIRQYAQYSNRVSVSYVNPAQNPTFMADFSEDNPATNDIIVRCGDRHIVVSSSDLFNQQLDTSTYSYRITSSRAEEAITSAMVNVISDTQIQVSLLTGYGESGYDAFVELLRKNNYNVITQNIVTEEIDPESKVVIVFAPAYDYDEEAVQKLGAFLENGNQMGKSLFYVANFEQPDTPNLNTLLEEWALQVGDGIVFETDNNNLAVVTPPYYGLSEYYSGDEDTTYIEDLKDPSKPVIVPFSKPIEVLNSEIAKPLLTSSEETSGVVPSDAGDDWTYENAEVKGPVNTAAICIKTRFDGTTPLISNLVVVGSPDALAEDVLSMNSFNNSAYFLNLFDHIAEREDNSITIESKSLSVNELGITVGTSLTLGVVFTIALPAVILIVGLVIWIRRRNR